MHVPSSLTDPYQLHMLVDLHDPAGKKDVFFLNTCAGLTLQSRSLLLTREFSFRPLA